MGRWEGDGEVGSSRCRTLLAPLGYAPCPERPRRARRSASRAEL